MLNESGELPGQPAELHSDIVGYAVSEGVADFQQRVELVEGTQGDVSEARGLCRSTTTDPLGEVRGDRDRSTPDLIGEPVQFFPGPASGGFIYALDEFDADAPDLEVPNAARSGVRGHSG